jgi:serine/threonine-protein kinase PknK
MVAGRVIAATTVAVAAACGLAQAAGAPSLPAPVYRTVAVAAGGRVYVLGGHDLAGGSVTSVEAFDPRSGATRPAGRLVSPTHGAAAASLHGRILVFGGASTSVHDIVQQFFPTTGRSRVIATMPTVRADVTATVAAGRVILVGGFDGTGPQSSVWATRDGRHFTVIAHLRQPVRYPAVAALGADVYAFGGLISGGEYTGAFTSDIQRVDLRTGSTRVIGHLSSPLAHAMAATVNGRVYLLGGSTPHGPTQAIRRLDPATGRTSIAGRLPKALTDAAVASVGSTIFLLGGISHDPLATILAFHPR